MSSILEESRIERCARGAGAMFTPPVTPDAGRVDAERSLSKRISAVDCLPRPSTLAGLAASILLGASLGVGVGRVLRGEFAPLLVGADRDRETDIAYVAALPVAGRFPRAIAPVAIVAPASGPALLGGGISVGVRGSEYVTVTGEAISVRSLIVEICRQAGVDLRSYAAPDRLYTGRLQGVPLAEAFRRILRAESYFIGLRFDARSGRTRMTWLQVVGSDASGGVRVGVGESEHGGIHQMHQNPDASRDREDGASLDPQLVGRTADRAEGPSRSRSRELPDPTDGTGIVRQN